MIKKFVVIYRSTYAIVDTAQTPPRVVSYPTLKRAARRIVRMIRMYYRDETHNFFEPSRAARLRDAMYRCTNDLSHANVMNLLDLWNDQDGFSLYLVRSKHIIMRIELKRFTVYDPNGKFVETFHTLKEAKALQSECGYGAFVRER